MTRPLRSAFGVLATVGAGLLTTSALINISGPQPRAELPTSGAAAAAFLAAMAFTRDGTRRLDRWGRLLTGVALSALFAVAALWQQTQHAAPRVLLLLIPVCLLFATAGLMVREAAVQRRRSRQRELRARLDGEEAERRRWARDLHDDTLQELAAVMVVLGAAGASHIPESQTRGIADAREVVGRQIQALHRLIAQMRPLALDTLGLNAAIEDLGRRAHETSGIDIEVHARHLPRLDPDTEVSLYRIVQEALTNAVRHSGATHITVETYAHPDRLEFTVRDDGDGPPPTGFAHGHGLTGIRERANTLGAALTLAGADGGGTLFRLRMRYPSQRPG